MGTLLQVAKGLLPARARRHISTTLAAHLKVPSMQWSLTNLRGLGFNPGQIVDVGAFEGEWTLMANKVFPESIFLMIDAQEDRRSRLELVKGAVPRSDYRIALLGRTEGKETAFNQYPTAPTASSVLQDQKSSPAKTVVCQMRSLDSVTREAGLTAPSLVKLDVQGYELEILEGAPQTLDKAEVILMEVSLIEIYKGNPLLHDVTAFMNSKGFQTYDICALSRRPLDQALCQIDAIFVRKDSSLLKHKTWD